MSRFENGLLCAVAGGAKSAFWGVVALWMGFTWAGVIAAEIPLSELTAMQWSGCTALFWMLLVLIGTPWGWLFLPVLAILFYGAIGREWNRLVVVSATATTVGTALFLSDVYWGGTDCHCNDGHWFRLVWPVVLLALSLLFPLLLRVFLSRRPPSPASAVATGGAGAPPRPLPPPPP